MLQNARVTAFAFSELLREDQQRGGRAGKSALLINIRINTAAIWIKI